MQHEITVQRENIDKKKTVLEVAKSKRKNINGQ
jgi:hypothetical protein